MLTKNVNGIDVELTQQEIDEYNQIQDAFEETRLERLKEQYSEAVQKHIDDMARTKDYGGGFACATYTASTNAQWKAESDAFVAWRDGVWEYAYQEFAKFENGERQEVPIDDFINELPVITWP